MTNEEFIALVKANGIDITKLPIADEIDGISLPFVAEEKLKTADMKRLRSLLGITIVDMTNRTATIEPNILYRWGDVTSLNIQLAPSDITDRVAEYMIEFSTGDVEPVITLPASVKWVDGEPAFDANSRCQISIVNDLALYAQWEKE